MSALEAPRRACHDKELGKSSSLCFSLRMFSSTVKVVSGLSMADLGQQAMEAALASRRHARNTRGGGQFMDSLCRHRLSYIELQCVSYLHTGDIPNEM